MIEGGDLDGNRTHNGVGRRRNTFGRGAMSSVARADIFRNEDVFLDGKRKLSKKKDVSK